MEPTYIRDKYLNGIKPYIGKELIKVLTGQRRVGKTTLLKQIMDLVKLEGNHVNTIYINKEHNDLRQI